MKSCENIRHLKTGRYGQEKMTPYRCRKCEPCKALKRHQWVSRLTYEAWQNEYHPVFVTLTYRKEPNGINAIKKIKKDFQKFIKRLRKRTANVRYFVTVERGSKTGRLHLHSILWSDLARKSYQEQRNALENEWGHGFCLLRIMYGGQRGFNYASKYILKDTIWYSYSRRPGLGASGKSEYLERSVTEYLKNRRIITSLRFRILGEEVETYAHSGWRKELRNILGISVEPLTGYHYTKEVLTIENYDEIKERLLYGQIKEQAQYIAQELGGDAAKPKE